jgi:hypothetical protein
VELDTAEGVGRHIHRIGRRWRGAQVLDACVHLLDDLTRRHGEEEASRLYGAGVAWARGGTYELDASVSTGAARQPVGLP